MTYKTGRGCSRAVTAELWGFFLVGGFYLLPYINNQSDMYQAAYRGVVQLPMQVQGSDVSAALQC